MFKWEIDDNIQPTFFPTKKEALDHLKASKRVGWVYKVKTLAMSYKVEEWKVESVKNIKKVEQPITLESTLKVSHSDPNIKVTDYHEDDLLASDFKDPAVGMNIHCYFCNKKASTVIDNKPLCVDCSGGI